MYVDQGQVGYGVYNLGYENQLYFTKKKCFQKISVFFELTQRGANKNWASVILENKVPPNLKLANDVINTSCLST